MPPSSDSQRLSSRILSVLERLLTQRCLTYAFLAGGVLWLAWLISVLLGSGYIDLAGQPVGTDYLQFYAAGRTLADGESAHLYDVEFQAQLERSIIGPDLKSYHAFITPPFFAWIFVPLAALPYGISFAIWSLLGVGLLGASVYLLNPQHPGRAFIWALTWFPVFASVSFGQNALLSLFLLTSVYALWRRERRFLAGMVLGLLLYKPQLTLGVGVLWLFRWREDWPALAGLVVSGLGLAGLSFGFLPEASQRYVAFVREVLPDLPTWQDFPIWHLHTVRGFWRMLISSQRIADVLTFVSTGAGGVAFWRLTERRSLSKSLGYAAAICFTIWITPHAMIYDWAVLLIPALIFWNSLSSWRTRLLSLYALVWVSAFLSGPLTVMQLRFLPLAVQISVPVLAMCLYTIYDHLLSCDKRQLPHLGGTGAGRLRGSSRGTLPFGDVGGLH